MVLPASPAIQPVLNEKGIVPPYLPLYLMDSEAVGQVRQTGVRLSPHPDIIPHTLNERTPPSSHWWRLNNFLGPERTYLYPERKDLPWCG